MTSTSITTIGGMLVVTQVIPKDEASIQMEAPAKAQAPPPAARTPPPPPPPPAVKVDDMTAMFLQGHPLSLGVVQILVGVMCVLFSLTACYSWKLVLHAFFGFAVAFVVSGSAAVATGRRTSVGRIWACLAAHVVSVWLGLGGVAFACWLLTTFPPNLVCDPQALDEAVWLRCTTSLDILSVAVYGLYGFLLVLLVLQVCVSVTVCVFCGKAAKLRSRYEPVLTAADDQRTLISPPASP